MTRGGKKRFYKKVGRQPVRKCYQEYCRSQYRQGLIPNGNGGWMPLSSLSEKIRCSFEAMIRKLG